MRIGQDQSLQHPNRRLVKLVGGDLPIVVLPNNILIPPEYPCNIQDDLGIAIRDSLRNFADINGNFHAKEQQSIFD